MFNSLLIANRGEIACRVARSARALGLKVIAVYSDADAGAAHVAAADEAWRIGPAPAAESYLRIDAVLEAAARSGAEAVHPGYGFLSENAYFAEATLAAGAVWVGPPAAAIRAMGLKDEAKRRMTAAGVAVVPGDLGEDQSEAALAAAAARIGWPVLIKARAGGGGKGMRRVFGPDGFAAALAEARREAASSFGDDRVMIEKLVERPRHIEVQVLADRFGGVIHLGERDCSLQRRHQKLIEEAPGVGVAPELRAALGAAAVRAAEAVGYVGAGTVEFIADASHGLSAERCYFLEMNTRLQVEHPVTEAVTGLDLVAWQLRIAAGERLPFAQADMRFEGWAMEARLCAEDASRDFMPSVGRLAHLALPTTNVRVDAGVRAGDAVTPHYDPMIAKLIAHGPTREAARQALARALEDTQAVGVATNAAFLRRLLDAPAFCAGAHDTGLIEAAGAALTADPPPADATAALAALALGGALEPPAAPGAVWDMWRDFRVFGPATRRIALSGAANEIVEISTNGARATARRGSGVEVAVDVVETRADAVTIVVDGQRRRVSLFREPGAVTLFERGLAHRFALDDPLAAVEEDARAEDVVRAPTPGLVTAVMVAVGDAVAKGQTLAVMEAMKMTYALPSPRDGVVATVAAQPGDQMTAGAVIVALEPAAEAQT